MTHRTLSKGISLVLALAVTLSLAMPALAADGIPVAAQPRQAALKEETAIMRLSVQPQPGRAAVSSFGVPAAYQAAYDEAFRVGGSHLAKLTNNGGRYGSSVITNITDGDVKTHWETGKPNTASFKNSITVAFDAPVELGSVVYYPRTQGAANKGFPTAFSIYASQSEQGEDFVPVCSGSAPVAAGGTQISFETTTFLRLRFVFDEANQNWAAAGELAFYRPDLLPARVDDLFADGTWSALAPGVTEEEVAELVNGMEDHPLRGLYADALELAQRLANGESAPGYTVYDVPARGPYGDDIGRAATWNQLFPYQPTGYYVVPGTKLDVYVEPGLAEGQSGSLPQLVLGQIAKDKNGWGRRFELKAGHNVVQVPGTDNMNPAALYFVNRNYGYTGILPDIRFADAGGGDGVRRFPLYYQDESTAGTAYLADRRDEAAFLQELEAYIPTLAATDAEAAAGQGNYNIAELGSANVLVSTSATGALKGVNQTGLDRRTGEEKRGPAALMTLHEENYNNMMTYAGYEPQRLGQTSAPDTSDPLYRQYRPVGRFMIRVFCQGPFGWGDAGYIGFNGGFSENNKRDKDMFAAVASCGQITGAGWALEHELGHLLEGSRVGRAEYTNNLFALQFQNEFEVTNRVAARFREELLRYNSTDYRLEERPDYIGGNFVLLGILYQLEAAYGDHGDAFSADSVYAKTLRWARDNGGRLAGLENGDTLSMNRFAVAASNALGIDLTNHFEHYGIEITAAARAQLDPGLAPNAKKTWLATGAADAKEVRTLAGESAASLELTRQDGRAVLTMDVPGAAAGAVQTYEILRDGALAGYALAGNASNVAAESPTNRVTWTDAAGNDGKDHTYQVRAYDARLNVSGDSEPVVFRAKEPYILLEGATLLTIHQSFDPLSVVAAHAADGQDLTAALRVEASDLNLDARGDYAVTYAVADAAGNETRLTVPFTVVSDFVYASDVPELSAKVGWGSLQKDKNLQGGAIKLVKNGTQTTFEKGLGAHASSEIVYDLTGTGFTWFESYVGIDQAMKNASNAKAKFQVYVDGELRYDSGAMLAGTSMGYVAVDLTGARQLRLATDSLGANGSDHTVWANARFAVADSKPIIYAEDVAFTDPAQVDLAAIAAAATAQDAEDGDLTAALTYTTDYLPGKTGSFSITYSVADSDGNTTQLTRSLAVVNSFVYLSDESWKSAKVGWGTIKRDLSLAGNPIKLATADGVETYEKGLGIHAYSEVVYDLTGKNFYYFTSEVGVDATAANGNSSVVFQVYVDGKLAAETPLMRKGTPAQHIQVPLAGAGTLKLVVTAGGNGNANDHADWADAKFLVAVAEADKQALTEAAQTARALKESDYTAETWQPLAEALAAAEEVLARPLATQQETDDALLALNAALNGLARDVKTAELEDTLRFARAMASLEYVDPALRHADIRLYNLNYCIEKAESLLADPTVTQKQVDDWVFMMKYTIEDMGQPYQPGGQPVLPQQPAQSEAEPQPESAPEAAPESPTASEPQSRPQASDQSEVQGAPKARPPRFKRF